MRKYIKEYYRKQKKRKRDNDRYVTEASNKIKAMWHLINRENGKIQEDDNKLGKKIGNNIISNPIDNGEKMNMFFTYTVAEVVQQNINKGNYNNSSQEINH